MAGLRMPFGLHVAEELLGIGWRLGCTSEQGPRLAGRGPGGQPFGRDRLRGLALRELRPRHPPRQLDDVMPEAADPAGAAEAEADLRLVVLIGIGSAAGFPDERRERADGPAPGQLEPGVFRLRRRDADQ